MTTNELQPDESGARPLAHGSAPKVRKALSRLKRELSDEELASTGVQKMLIEDLERQLDENAELRGIREDYHTSDKQLAVLKEKHKRFIASEMVSMGCLAIGAAAIGYGLSVWNQPGSVAVIAVVFGALLTVVGIAAKVIHL